MYTCIHVCLYVCMYVCTYVCLYAYMYSYMHTCIHVFHTYIHTYTHTYRHTYIHTLNCKCLNSPKYEPWRRLPPQVEVAVLLLNETRSVGLEQHMFSIDIYVKGYRPILLRVYQYETRPDANRNYTDLAIDMQIRLIHVYMYTTSR